MGRAEQRHRIAIDFKNLNDAKTFFASMVLSGILADDARLYRMDGLDEIKRHGGITNANTLIVRRKGDRDVASEVGP
jgi:hypothetical protein